LPQQAIRSCAAARWRAWAAETSAFALRTNLIEAAAPVAENAAGASSRRLPWQGGADDRRPEAAARRVPCKCHQAACRSPGAIPGDGATLRVPDGVHFIANAPT